MFFAVKVYVLAQAHRLLLGSPKIGEMFCFMLSKNVFNALVVFHCKTVVRMLKRIKSVPLN